MTTAALKNKNKNKKRSQHWFPVSTTEEESETNTNEDTTSSSSTSIEGIEETDQVATCNTTRHHHQQQKPANNTNISSAVYLYSACAALNSVNLGYDLGVSTNAGPLLQKDFNLSNVQLELFLGCLNFFSIFGALISPIITDTYGRRASFIAAAIGFILGISIMCYSSNFTILISGRLLVGLSVGVGEAIDPMYIAEMTPPSIRGELVSWAEAGVALGVVLGFCSSLVSQNWRIMLGLGAILPFVMIFLATQVMPESPRWLLSKQQDMAARVILSQLYSHDEAQVEQIVREIQESLALEQAAAHTVGWGMILRPSPAVRRMLMVGVGIAIIQQAVGIDSIMFYLMFIIQDSGVTSESAQLGALILLGLVKLLFVFVGAKLFDRYGRRPLLFASLLGCAASLIVVSITITSDTSVSETMTILALAVYLACFSSGLGPGNWVIVSEVFATSIRAKAMSVAVFPNRVTATIMSSTFLTMANYLTWPGFFLLLAGICIASAAFLYIYLPETKGRSLESMAHFFAEVTGDRSILDTEEHLANMKLDHEHAAAAKEIEMGTTGARLSTGVIASTSLEDKEEGQDSNNVNNEADIAAGFLM